jgi:DNA-binding HxlR family transcriptional regulator
VGDKWTLLIVRDLAAGPRRFVELQRVLPGISTEQLRSRLNRMVADGMLTRKRYREVPPRVDYELTERARDLMPILGELARWGYEWAWSTPRAAENVDVSAIFRLAPGLIRSASGENGTVELKLQRDGETFAYSLTLSSDGASVHERPTEQPDARIAGDTAAWVSAFSPEGDRGALEIMGDRRLAEQVLEGLVSSSPRATHSSASAAA